jgi:hypothetical protein
MTVGQRLRRSRAGLARITSNLFEIAQALASGATRHAADQARKGAFYAQQVSVELQQLACVLETEIKSEEDSRTSP